MSETIALPTTGPSGGVMITDSTGRVLEVKSISLSEELNLIEAAGQLSDVARWMMIATFACTVRSIDGLPLPMPRTQNQIRGAVAKVGSQGLKAAIAALSPEDVPDDADEVMAGQKPDLAKN